MISFCLPVSEWWSGCEMYEEGKVKGREWNDTQGDLIITKEGLLLWGEERSVKRGGEEP
jgi:hypothetical protein